MVASGKVYLYDYTTSRMGYGSIKTECSTVGKWYRDPYNECSYYECNGAQKVRRLCAQGIAVPPDYQDESAVAPCSIFNNQACAPCKFPSEIQHPVRWWYRRENNEDVLLKFTNHRIEYLLASDLNNPTRTETCIGHLDSRGSVYFTRSKTTNGSVEACVEQTDVKLTHFIFRKTKEGNPLAQNLVAKPCPLPSGQYYTTYSSGPGQEDQCINDVNSVAVVNGNTIDFNTCGSGDTQKNPYKAKLTCLDTFAPSTVWNEGGNSNGDILLLANEARDRFYCARYRVDDNTMNLSLDVTPDTTRLTCRTDVNYRKFGDDSVGQFRAFLLSDTLLTTATTTKTTTTTTTTTTHTKPTTTTRTTKKTSTRTTVATTTTMTTTTSATTTPPTTATSTTSTTTTPPTTATSTTSTTTWNSGSENRITVAPGSTIVQFVIPSGSGDAPASLKWLIEYGQITTTAPDGSTVNALPNDCRWWTGNMSIRATVVGGQVICPYDRLSLVDR
ncbi:hypothetical protein LSAT2_017493 [Lamellibrachia satsuma]|nr:hypothetical protein LSAT2_017493 [Lamellibrachia satsuma]